ncbi:MAG TPA: MutH/Sau3AI family endonuclease [Myxococcales bacterium LLY-WYZ-16_1]|nr:MutH/Sau3AI family endonuclease [Myxococcales bacterium LLY-WYZ-16_1]
METFELQELGAPPRTEAELLSRAEELARWTVGELADALAVEHPNEPARAKGFVGNLLERALGATADNRPVPDFEALGVELKSVPVDTRGRPRESTFVTTVCWPELADGTTWARSSLRQKTARILWIPVEADERWPLPNRRIGRPLLWSPAPDDEARLASDWDLFGRAVRSGEPEAITAEWGEVLQMRPKAADSRARTRLAHPTRAEALPPRGFYVRSRFTRALFARAYLLPEDG